MAAILAIALTTAIVGSLLLCICLIVLPMIKIFACNSEKTTNVSIIFSMVAILIM